MTEWIDQFRDCPILVVGDVMLDEFIWGTVNRISPEAPVPVVEVSERTFTVGGAANTAANVRSLGGKVVVCGMIGDDEAGRKVQELLKSQGIDTAALLMESTRPTITKTRVVAHNQQMVRIDFEKPGPIDAAFEARLLDSLASILKGVRGVVLSDYGKGVLTPSFCREFLSRAKKLGLPVVVDPKGTDYAKYRGATLVKPNLLEAGQVLNRVLKTESEVRSAGAELLEFFGQNTSLLITRGAHGMVLFQPAVEPVQIPTQAREVYDVTGAGDTVAGTLALGLAVGAELETACKLATSAAAVVVGKVGTATCSQDELRKAIGSS